MSEKFFKHWLKQVDTRHIKPCFTWCIAHSISCRIKWCIWLPHWQHLQYSQLHATTHCLPHNVLHHPPHYCRCLVIRTDLCLIFKGCVIFRYIYVIYASRGLLIKGDLNLHLLHILLSHTSLLEGSLQTLSRARSAWKSTSPWTPWTSSRESSPSCLQQ